MKARYGIAAIVAALILVYTPSASAGISVGTFRNLIVERFEAVLGQVTGRTQEGQAARRGMERPRRQHQETRHPTKLSHR